MACNAMMDSYKLGHLLRVESLGLELLVGPPGALERPVLGAHSVEIPNPARWMEAGWILLTTGVSLPNSEAEHRRLVADTDEERCTAIGFGIGLTYDSVPAALLDEARQRGFPVFSIPLSTAFKDITREVWTNVLGRHTPASTQLAAIERSFLEVIGGEHPREAMAERLSAVLGCEVALVRWDGGHTVATNPLPLDEILEANKRAPARQRHFETAGFHGILLDIPLTDGRHQTLVLAVPKERQLHNLLEVVGQASVPLLQAISRMEYVVASQESAAARVTLEQILAARSAFEADAAAARLAALGMNMAHGVRISMIEVSEDTPAAAQLAIERVAQGLLIPATMRSARLVLLCPAAEAADLTRSALEQLPSQSCAGIGRVVSNAEAISVSMRDAQVALKAARCSSGKRAVPYEDLDVPNLLVCELPVERLAARVSKWLEPLRENPIYMSAVKAYFENDLDVALAARALGLHHNSVRYRLKKAEQLLGADLRDPSTILALYVAESMTPPGAEDTASRPDISLPRRPL